MPQVRLMLGHFTPDPFAASHQASCMQVLFSRYVGQIRQGRWADPHAVDWPSQSQAMKELLLNASRSYPDYKASALAEFQRAGFQVDVATT